MIDLQGLKLQGEYKQNKVMLWAERDGKRIHINDWKPLLFTWHEPSYYGTFLEKNDDQAIFLRPWEAWELFSRYPSFFFQSENMDDTVQDWLFWAKELDGAIEEERIEPDFEAWKAGIVQWKLGGKTIASSWAETALTETIQRNPERLGIDSNFYQRFVQLREMGALEALSSLDKDTWLRKIGWIPSHEPFSLIFQLKEPEEGETNWTLSIFLQDKNEMLRLSYSGKGTLFPELWKPYEEKIADELAFAESMIPWLQVNDRGEWNESINEREAWDFLSVRSEQLRQLGIETELPVWWQTVRDFQPKVKAKVKSQQPISAGPVSYVGLSSIMQFDWRFATGDAELTEEQFKELVDSSKRLVKVSGQWFTVDPEWVKKVRNLMKSVDRKGIQLKDVLEQHLLSLQELDNDKGEADNLPQVSLEWGDSLNKWMNQLTETSSIPVLPDAQGLKGSLRDYQKTGSSWMYFLRRFGLGGCLADDMGLGKTIQTIDYFLKVKEAEKSTVPFLLICPTSVLGNWQKELQHFAPDFRVGLHYGGSRKKGKEFQEWIKSFDVILTSYTTAQLDEQDLRVVMWNSIVLDEAQNIKNSFTKQSRSIRRLNGSHKLALTGTPVENRLLELWSIFDFLNPGYLGSEPSFQRRFVQPVERANDQEKLFQLRRLVQPFLLRRTKSDPAVQLNLPEKQEIKEYCPLSPEQASLYERLVQDTFEQLEKAVGMKRRGLLLAMLGKLKQICDHPVLYAKEEKAIKLEERSAKFSKMSELVDEIVEKEEKCLIFTQFIYMGELMKLHLEKKLKKPVLFLHGSLSKKARDELIDRFQEGDDPVFILSLKAGGTGLNLTEANHVIHYDRWWNPAVENQATDRAHRIGQKKFVTVHKLITLGTLEEKIDEMLESKKELSEKVIQSENWITELSTDELKDIFTLRKDWVEA